jgi:hypothetical protein
MKSRNKEWQKQQKNRNMVNMSRIEVGDKGIRFRFDKNL